MKLHCPKKEQNIRQNSALASKIFCDLLTFKMRIASEINPPLKWKSFDVNEATWEPKDTMDCEEMICEFEGKQFVEDPLTAPSLALPFSGPDNEYEMQRLQNIARAQKLFKDNLQATSRALKGKKSKPSKPLIKCDYDYCNRVFKVQLTFERHKRVVHKVVYQGVLITVWVWYKFVRRP